LWRAATVHSTHYADQHASNNNGAFNADALGRQLLAVLVPAAAELQLETNLSSMQAM
jgi:hypothetical protein